MEGPRQIVAHAGDGNVMLLHGLQQGRLGAGAGAVDFVGHHQLAEHRARHEAELAAAGLGLVQHFGAEDVGGHQVGRELHALFIEAQHAAQGRGELGLGEARGADQQGMATAQNGDQHLFHHLVLAEDDAADGFAGLSQPFACRLEVGDDLPVCFIDAGHEAHYSLVPGHHGLRHEIVLNDILVNENGLKEAGYPRLKTPTIR